MIPVITRSYDNSRSHANTKETELNPTTVGQRGVRHLFSLAVDDPRIEAQPLVVPNVLMYDGLHHDICILCSMGNKVYAYDLNDGEPLWMQKVGSPILGSKSIDAWLINVYWGILSTPVIDLETGILYVCCWTSPDGTKDKAVFKIHALDIQSGSPVSSPIDFSNVSYQPPNNLPLQKFGAAARKQRAGLLLTKVNNIKTIFVTFGSVSESLQSARGWVIAVDVSHWKVSAAWTTTSRYSGAGIWMGGEGPSADGAGHLYAVTGNGAFDNVTDFGESFLKLVNTPPIGTTPGKIQCVDWFTPFTDAGRDGEPQDQALITDQGEDRPSNMDDWTDQDLGSAGALLIPGRNLVMGAGKDGIVYVLDSNRMGKSQLKDMANPALNYQKAKYIGWFTFFPGFNHTPVPQEFTDLNVNYFGVTHHQHGTPVYYRSAMHGDMIFTQGENSTVRAWKVNDNGSLAYLAESDERASPEARVPPGGMPGGMLTLSANGDRDALIWTVIPMGDANKQITPGVLMVYNAENFGLPTNQGGSPRLRLLWRSDRWNWRFNMAKFNVPVVAGGRILIPTYDGQVMVLGLG